MKDWEKESLLGRSENLQKSWIPICTVMLYMYFAQWGVLVACDAILIISLQECTHNSCTYNPMICCNMREHAGHVTSDMLWLVLSVSGSHSWPADANQLENINPVRSKDLKIKVVGLRVGRGGGRRGDPANCYHMTLKKLNDITL